MYESLIVDQFCVHIYIYIYRYMNTELIHDTQSVQISQKQDEHNIYVIMKTTCPLSYHHNGFVATHALGQIRKGYTLLVPMNQRVLSKSSNVHNISGHSDPRHTECSNLTEALCVVDHL